MEQLPRRCAIYTRKSSDDGLDQTFNSLQAQREACEAFVSSQKANGWMLSEKRYDDGGYSGGSLDRPALAQLLADVNDSEIDTVVVHKIDRLTRSIRDFGRIAERLEAQGASIASVTQQFNTSTSMGRLTLNMLLSFAQFERELTSERIREKLQASRQKGMWMGGCVPFGYVQADRTLEEHPTDGVLLREIFQRYRKLGSQLLLQRSLDCEPAFRAARLGGAGKTPSRGALRHLLSNRIYLGEINNKGDWVPGLHPPLVEKDLFWAVQRIQAERSDAFFSRRRRGDEFPLRGIVFDVSGKSAHVVKSAKGHRSYRYLQFAPTSEQDRPRRLSAQTLERRVRFLLQSLSDHIGLRTISAVPATDLLGEVSRVSVGNGGMTVELKLETEVGLARRAQTSLSTSEERFGPDVVATATREHVLLTAPFPKRSWPLPRALVVPKGAKMAARPLLAWASMGRAHHWLNQMLAGEKTFQALSIEHGLSSDDLMQALRPAFAPPAVARKVLGG